MKGETKVTVEQGWIGPVGSGTFCVNRYRWVGDDCMEI